MNLSLIRIYRKTLCYGKKGLQSLFSILLIVLSITISITVLELLLVYTTIFDERDNPSPVYIPKKFKAIDDEINSQNRSIALLNKYFFNDIPRTETNKDKKIRIAVLGDSFIWGDGVPYDMTWGHQLERKLLEQYENVEILNWGQNGWSTDDQLRFLKRQGVDYHIDYLIIGFVTNDPVFRTPSYAYHIPQKFFQWQNSDVLTIGKKIFPNSIDFISSYVNRFLENYFFHDYGYQAWQEKLYTKENLSEYKQLLLKLFEFCQRKETQLLFVLTPSNYAEHFKTKYQKIIPLLQEVEIQHLNLYPAILEKLGAYNLRELWTNLANGHPGKLVTSVYADEVFAYITTNSSLSKTLKKCPNNRCANSYIGGINFIKDISPADKIRQYEFGLLYYHGEGSAKQNFIQAHNWFQKSAEQGFPPAQYKLGQMYNKAEGISQNLSQATQWFNKAMLHYHTAAVQGNDQAQYQLGQMYYNGEGASSNFVLAEQWYRKAAEQGNAEAQYQLGQMYYEGKGVSQDFVKAKQWYHKSAIQGSTEAQHQLGKMYHDGEAVKKDLNQAAQWYRKAAISASGKRRAIAMFNESTHLYRKVGKLNEAIANQTDLIALIADYPQYGSHTADAYLGRGYLYSQQGHLDQAIADYTRIIDFAPNYSKAYIYRGKTYYRKNLIGKGITDQIQGFKLQAQHYQKKKAWNQALANYNQLIILMPTNPKIYLERGKVYIHLDNWEQAQIDFDKALEITNQYSELYQEIQQMLQQKKD